MAPMMVENPFTGRLEPQSVPVQIDEQTLKKIAEVTGGAYFRATDAEALRQVYAQIDQLERTEFDEARFLDHHEYFRYFLALGLLLACLGWLLQASVFRRLP
jgi:Ca-activated chloride channel family protein